MDDSDTVRHPLYTRLCREFGCEFPIVALTHCKDVAAAVTNAGGIGIWGGHPSTVEEYAETVEWIRAQVGGRPFGTNNLFSASFPATGSTEDMRRQIPDGHWRFLSRLREEYAVPELPEDARRKVPDLPLGRPWGPYGQVRPPKTLAVQRAFFEAMIDLEVPIISSGLGSPSWMTEAAHARGLSVWGQVGRVRQAVRLAEGGVDYIVATGYDGGGHVGTVGTFSLVPRVVDAVGETPVLAAGGVGSGRHLVGSLALGAVGVWTGTIWLATRESDIHHAWKEKLLAATEDDTARSKALTGKPVRQVESGWTQYWQQDGAPEPLPMPLQGQLVEETLESINRHDIEELMPAVGGQVVGLIDSVRPCRDVLLDMATEAVRLIEGWQYGSDGDESRTRAVPTGA